MMWTPAVLLPAGFRHDPCKPGFLFREAHGIELAGGYLAGGVHEIIPSRPWPGVAERDVILRRAAFVAISLDFQLVIRILTQDLGQFLPNRRRGVAMASLRSECVLDHSRSKRP